MLVFEHVSEVMSAFMEEWAKGWGRHRDVPQGRGVHQLRLKVPSFERIAYEPISLDKWMSCLRAKKRRAAVGPDGVSRGDLLSMPAQLHQCLVHHVACTAPAWARGGAGKG